MKLIIRMRALVRDTKGQDLLEYALLVALISLVAYGMVEASGSSVNDIFTSISEKLDTAAAAGGN